VLAGSGSAGVAPPVLPQPSIDKGTHPQPSSDASLEPSPSAGVDAAALEVDTDGWLAGNSTILTNETLAAVLRRVASPRERAVIFNTYNLGKRGGVTA